MSKKNADKPNKQAKTAKKKLTPADRARVQAYCALELADYEAALKPARYSLSLSPDNAISEAILALALRGVQKNHEAIIHAEKARDLAPNNPEIAFICAMCQWFMQPDSELLKVMSQSLNRLPERADMRVDYAGFLLQLQRFDDAAAQAEQALQTATNSTKAKIVLKCARNHSWSNIISRPVTTPPLPVEGNDSFTYTSIAGFHLRANGFEIAMDKCCHTLDSDLDNKKAKSIFCTAHHLKGHDFAALCHYFSVKMHDFSNRFIYLFIPLLGLFGLSLVAYKHHDAHYYFWGLAALLYLMIYFQLQVWGEKRISANQFDEIVRNEHLTPQGRIQRTVERRNELDEVVEKKQLVTSTYDSFTEVQNQIERTSQRLVTVSKTYSAFAFVAMFFLLASIVIQSNPENALRNILPYIQKGLGILTVFLVFMAFVRRNKAHKYRSRLIESHAFDAVSDVAKEKP